jgi:hypothetical protein
MWRTDPGISLQDQRQGQLCGRHGRVAFRAVPVNLGQLGLELLVEYLMRCRRRNTNNFARRTALITTVSASEGSTGGDHSIGRIPSPSSTRKHP